MMPYQPPPLSPPAQERQLLDLVERLAHRRRDRLVLHIHLSLLAPAYRRPAYTRIAAETFQSQVIGTEGQFFNLANKDLIFIGYLADQAKLHEILEHIEILFASDPLMTGNAASPEEGFYGWYVLGDDESYERFKIIAQNILKTAQDNRQKEVMPPYKRSGPQPVEPSVLAALEQNLGNADISMVARRQPVCTIIDQMHPQVIFEELYVSIDDLERASTPDTDLLGDPWLFRYLTQTLDRRVMSMLIRDGVNWARPFSINLNVGTVLSPDFARFESIVAPQLRGRLVVEMNKLDVFSDLGAFHFARDYLHDHGFRVCLDGLTHHTLPYYDRERLGFDLVKLYWTPNSLDTMPESQTPQLRTLVRETGQANTILCRCDDEKALAVGQDIGIVMYQGHAVDKRLKK